MADWENSVVQASTEKAEQIVKAFGRSSFSMNALVYSPFSSSSWSLSSLRSIALKVPTLLGSRRCFLDVWKSFLGLRDGLLSVNSTSKIQFKKKMPSTIQEHGIMLDVGRVLEPANLVFTEMR